MPSMTGGDQLGEDYAPWAHEPEPPAKCPKCENGVAYRDQVCAACGGVGTATPPTLEELRQARVEAMEEREGVKRYIRRATENYERKLNENHAAQLAEMGRAIAEVEKAIAELELAAEERRVAEIAQADPRVGKMYRMFSPKYRFATPDHGLRPTETLGVAMVLTTEMSRMCQKRGYHWPNAGDIVIRQLKKDGTPSAYYYDIRNDVMWREEVPNANAGSDTTSPGANV